MSFAASCVNIPINNRASNSNTQSNLSQILQNFFQPVEVFPTQSQIEAIKKFSNSISCVKQKLAKSTFRKTESFGDENLCKGG